MSLTFEPNEMSFCGLVYQQVPIWRICHDVHGDQIMQLLGKLAMIEQPNGREYLLSVDVRRFITAGGIRKFLLAYYRCIMSGGFVFGGETASQRNVVKPLLFLSLILYAGVRQHFLQYARSKYWVLILNHRSYFFVDSMAELALPAKAQKVLSAYSVNRRMTNHLHVLTRKQTDVDSIKTELYFPLKQVEVPLEADVNDIPITRLGYIDSYEPSPLYYVNLLPGSICPGCHECADIDATQQVGDSGCKPS